MAQLKSGTTISGYLALHRGNLSDYAVGVPGGSTGDIQYNSSGSFGGFGSVNTYTVQLDKPLLMASASISSYTTEARIAFDDNGNYANKPVYTLGGAKAGWEPFDNQTFDSRTSSSGSSTQNITMDGTTRNLIATLSGSGTSFTTTVDLAVRDGDEGILYITQLYGNEKLFISSSTTSDIIIMGTYSSIGTGSMTQSTVSYKRFNDVLILSYFPSASYYPYVAP